MNYRNPGFRRSIIALFASTLILTTSAVMSYASDGSFSLNQPGPEWVRNLPAALCPWSSTDTYCHRSSPAVADITGNGKMEIVVATNNGYVLAVTHDGSVLWKTDVGPAFGKLSPVNNFNSLPDLGKWWSAFLMLLGRLELFTVMILFTPYFWKSNKF